MLRTVYMIKIFNLEFTKNSWFYIAIAYIFLVVFITAILCILVSLKIESPTKINSKTGLLYSLSISLNICLKAYINKPTSTGLKSQSFKLLLTTIMCLSFVILSYYRAQMNAALNVQVEKFPIETWEDVEKREILYFAQNILSNFSERALNC